MNDKCILKEGPRLCGIGKEHDGVSGMDTTRMVNVMNLFCMDMRRLLFPEDTSSVLSVV